MSNLQINSNQQLDIDQILAIIIICLFGGILISCLLCLICNIRNYNMEYNRTRISRRARRNRRLAIQMDTAIDENEYVTIAEPPQHQ
jgi:hypothetical protein